MEIFKDNERFFFNFNGIKIEINEDGHLMNPSDWNENLARFIAENEGIERLTQAHWEIIGILRKYFMENNYVCGNKVLSALIYRELYPEKANSSYLFELFPGGPSKQGNKIAGLPKYRG